MIEARLDFSLPDEAVKSVERAFGLSGLSVRQVQDDPPRWRLVASKFAGLGSVHLKVVAEGGQLAVKVEQAKLKLGFLEPEVGRARLMQTPFRAAILNAEEKARWPFPSLRSVELSA